MTIIKEHRIVLPISCDEYQVGQLFSVAEASKENTGGGEGVEVLENVPYSLEKIGKDGQPYTEKGQYTHKVFRMESKVPKMVRTIMGGDKAFEFHEKAWNAFPYCKTVITNPHYMGDNFECKIETWHKDQDVGGIDNVHELPADVWKKITDPKSKDNMKNPKVVQIDIVKDVPSPNHNDYKVTADPGKHKFQKEYDNHLSTPLKATWLTELKALHKNRDAIKKHLEQGTASYTQADLDDIEAKMPKHMCCYKLVTLKFKWKVIGGKIETVGINQQKRIFSLFHQQLWCWFERWQHMSMQDIRDLEEKTKRDLDNTRDQGNIKGMKASDD